MSEDCEAREECTKSLATLVIRKEMYEKRSRRAMISIACRRNMRKEGAWSMHASNDRDSASDSASDRPMPSSPVRALSSSAMGSGATSSSSPSSPFEPASYSLAMAGANKIHPLLLHSSVLSEKV